MTDTPIYAATAAGSAPVPPGPPQSGISPGTSPAPPSAVNAGVAGTGEPQSGVSPGATVQAPPSVNVLGDLDTLVARLVAERLAGVQSAFDQRIAAIEKRHMEEMRALTRGAPVDQTPEHGAGPGLHRLQTWSQHLQDLARAGALTAEHVMHAHGVTLEEATEFLARL